MHIHMHQEWKKEKQTENNIYMIDTKTEYLRMNQ